MIKKKVIRQVIFLVSLIVLLVSTVNFTFGFVVTKTDSAINTFPPLLIEKNDVVLSKTVEHPLGNDYEIPDNIAFDFQLNLGQIYANTTIKTSSGDMITDANGTISVSLKPDESLTLQEIDVGTKVTVTEKQVDGSGFNVKDGEFTKEATVTQDGSLTIDYVNVYTPKSVVPASITVVGKEYLYGRDRMAGDSFSFVLEQLEENGHVHIETKTVTYHASDLNTLSSADISRSLTRDNGGLNNVHGEFDFTAIFQTLEFDEVGIYDFRVRQIEGDLPNITYDTNVFVFSVEVTDVDMDGRLEINNVTAEQSDIIKYENGIYAVNVDFHNVYAESTPDTDKTSVLITVDKIVKNVGKHSIGKAGFEFVLTNEETGERIVLNSDSDGKAIFSLLFGTGDAGKTYSYTLTETDKGMEGVTYDTSVYRISVSITLDGSGKPIATVTVNGEAVADAVARFENVYNGEPEAPPTGIDSDSLIYVIIMALSSVFCTSIICTERKRRNRI